MLSCFFGSSLDEAIRQLHVAMELPEFAQVLQGLVPTKDAQNQLKLLTAIMEFQQAQVSRRSEMEGAIRDKFLSNTSPNRVSVPAAIMRKPFDEMMDRLDYYMLAELVKLPEVRAAVELKHAQNPTSTTSRYVKYSVELISVILSF
jgi:hypothetical protein